jgi:hypothetical protein
MDDDRIALALGRREKAMAVTGYEPQTSTQFRMDLCRQLFALNSAGVGIIEVGCYTGGTTVVLVSVCEQLGWPLYVVDIWQEHLTITGKVLNSIADKSEMVFFLGDLDESLQKACGCCSRQILA